MSFLQAGSPVPHALLLGKSGKKRQERVRAYLPPEVSSPQMPVVKEDSVRFQQASFCAIWFLGWWSSPQSMKEITWRKKIMDLCLKIVGWENSSPSFLPYNFLSSVYAAWTVGPELAIHPQLQGSWFWGYPPLSCCPPGMSPQLESKLPEAGTPFPFFHLTHVL